LTFDTDYLSNIPHTGFFVFILRIEAKHLRANSIIEYSFSGTASNRDDGNFTIQEPPYLSQEWSNRRLPAAHLQAWADLWQPGVSWTESAA
jgi:hypothetical protein